MGDTMTLLILLFILYLTLFPIAVWYLLRFLEEAWKKLIDQVTP